MMLAHVPHVHHVPHPHTWQGRVAVAAGCYGAVVVAGIAYSGRF